MTTTPTAPQTVEQLLDQITGTKAQLAILEGRLAGLLDQLSTALDQGEIDSSFSHEDWTFTHCAGRKTWDYPKAVKAQIKSLQEAAQASGAATQETGAGYWSIKPPAIDKGKRTTEARSAVGGPLDPPVRPHLP